MWVDRGGEEKIEGVVTVCHCIQVTHYEEAIKDIRDTCYRNIHLDLLLEKYVSLGEK